MAEANTPGDITVKRIVREYAFTLLILLAVLGTLYYGWPALIAYFFPLGGVIPATIATIESKQTRSTRRPAPYQGEVMKINIKPKAEDNRRRVPKQIADAEIIEGLRVLPVEVRNVESVSKEVGLSSNNVRQIASRGGIELPRKDVEVATPVRIFLLFLSMASLQSNGDKTS
jgi:uncharacterized protein (DUF58 family)